MVRAPCCEKMGLKRGPWTKEEDEILISYIQKYGHGNWRALPKHAGLLRCGKSCRLRWKNYLRPDIKRGNFSREEEDTIISLHEMLGNRWSAIAARLPGRTDNEIKNVWHTHLKKRVNPNSDQKIKIVNDDKIENGSPNCSYSGEEASSVATRESNDSEGIKEESMDSFEGFPEIEESFWLDALSINAGFDSTSAGGEDMSYWLKVFMENGDNFDLEIPDL